MQHYKHIILNVLALLIAGIPTIAFAAPTDFKGLVSLFISYVNLLIPLVIAMTLLVFFWGLAVFIRSAGDEEGIKNGKKLMFWGIISLFVAVSLGPIVMFVAQDILGGSMSGYFISPTVNKDKLNSILPSGTQLQ